MTEIAGSWEDAVRWLCSQPGNEALVRDAYYDDPLLDAAERYWLSSEWAAVRTEIGSRSGRALDVGAGRGIASYALARDGFDVVALEPDPSAVVGADAIRALAAETSLPITVEQRLSETLPFADRSFDVVFCRAVLHHIGDLPAAMREFNRILKPGGIFCAIREHVLSTEADLPAFLDGHPLHHRYGGENAFRSEVYERAIRQAGFPAIRVIRSLESPINFGPQSAADVHRQIVERVVPFAAARPLGEAMLNLPGVGTGVRALLSRADRRPGRHHSFIAEKPAVEAA
jgi:SAM-dependent methyltransferase